MYARQPRLHHFTKKKPLEREVSATFIFVVMGEKQYKFKVALLQFIMMSCVIKKRKNKTITWAWSAAQVVLTCECLLVNYSRIIC